MRASERMPEIADRVGKRCGLPGGELSDPDSHLDVETWTEAAEAVLAEAGGDEDLFLLGGQKAGAFDLMGAIEFLPWFLSGPTLFIRNVHIFQAQLDTIMAPSVEYVTENRCRIAFRPWHDARPPEQYLSFLQGFLTAAVGLWDCSIEQCRGHWEAGSGNWILSLEWKWTRERYRRVMEELFVEPHFFRAVAGELIEIRRGRSKRLEELLRLNKELRALASKREKEAAKVERRPAHADERYGGLLSKLQDGVIKVAPDGTILDANPAALRIANYPSLDDLREKAPNIVDHFENPFAFRRLTVAYSKQGFIKDYELRLRRGDGHTVVLLISAFAGRDSSTGQEIIEGVLRDITDQRRIQRALGETHQFLEAIFLNNPSGLQVLDPEGWTVRVNPQLVRMFGFELEEIIGKGSYSILADPAFVESGISHYLKQALDGRSVQTPTVQLSGVDSPSPFLAGLETPIYVNVTAYPLSPEGGLPSHVVVSYSDVTEAYLIEQQLVQIQKLQSIGTLASSIAHDFNNILGAIVPNAEMILAKAEDGGETARRAITIKSAAKRAASLTGQLMSFARESRGDRKPLDLNAAVREAIELIGNAIPKQVSLDFEPDDAMPPVLADPLQVQQVLINLIINASDAVPRGGMIAIRTEPYRLQQRTTFGGNLVAPGPYARLSVADDGVGIPPEVVERVFDPFFTTKEKGRGTGLGMSVVHGIVKNHNGFVQIDSSVGRGTEVSVYLPVRRGGGGGGSGEAGGEQ